MTKELETIKKAREIIYQLSELVDGIIEYDNPDSSWAPPEEDRIKKWLDYGYTKEHFNPSNFLITKVNEVLAYMTEREKELTKSIELHPSSLKVTEAAAFMNVSKAHVYDLIRAGEIHSLQFGRNRRIPRSSFDSYLRAVDWPADDLD